MEKAIIAKRTIQCISICYGLIGLSIMGVGTYFILYTAKNEEIILKVLVAFIFALPGFLILFSTFQNIFRFSEKSIKSISAIITLTIFAFFIDWFKFFVERISNILPPELYEGIINLFPLVIAFIIYIFLVKIMTKITRRQPVKYRRSPTIDDDRTVAL
ncbi:hypothetical protein ACFL2O_03565 [Thermodesulfobacteriota bacterium]